jgi:iron complex outermembrane receptor protein
MHNIRRFRLSSLTHALRVASGTAVVTATLPFAATAAEIEEVIVTAQRTAESLQDVPIAVTAMTGEMLEEKQVITVSDVQMNAPNVSFTSTNFGSNSFSIRGIGRLVTASTGDAGVSVHTNEIALGPNLSAAEFYDMERVEVLRGPQGTLFGKNATGGVINFVTKMPEMDSTGGFLDVEYGAYQNQRVKGAVNLPIGDTFAIRLAGMQLKRDGYTDNLAFGQVGLDGRVLNGISDTVDGRDITDFRITARWEPNDRTNIWVMYNRFDEDDDRARITNQVCVQGPLPTYGCDPDGVGFESPNLVATFDSLVAGLYGLVPFEADLGGNFNWPRPQLGLRSMHTDFQPTFVNEIDTFTFGAFYEFDKFTVSAVGGYQEALYIARQDYNMDVGPELGPNFYRNDGLYPISETAGGPGDEFRPGPCNAFDGNSGVIGGVCIQDYGQATRRYTFDQSDSQGDGWTFEAKVQSSFDGRFNFLLGALAFDNQSNGDYYVNSSLLDARPDYYPGFFNNTGDPSGATFGEGYAVFGESYFDVTDRVKLTVGLRYNNDKKSVRDTSLLWNAQDVNFPGSTAVGGNALDPLFTRLPAFVQGGAPTAAEQGLIDLYGQTDAAAAAAGTPAQSPERLAVANVIPLVPDFGETRAVTGSPSEFEWTEVTGRIGVDWQITDETMVYGFFSRGYKPGGANPAIPPQFQDDSSFSFEQENIDAYELGMKTSLFDRTMVLNGALFTYNYEGLQVARIKNNTSLNENIDAQITGLELEMVWQPQFLPNMSIDAAYSWLDTSVDGSQSVDPVDREGGDSDFVTLNDFAFLYAARRDQITQPIIDNGVAAGAIVPAAGTYDDGLPAVISRAYLNAVGVETVEGVPANLDGNQLPNSPEHTIHLGVAYTWDIQMIAGSITARWDYYWQDESFAREFNRPGDRIDAWDQHNASLIYDSNNGKWTGRAWVRNLQDEDNVTGHYLTSDTSGYYRNYFVTEPRIYGASVRYNFGG